ncbi:hypothetical protein O0L34_g18679 [Tuta absoluta]|nr:hypothetical protein O0L34_g18679 [Tuta absoluta]
MESKLYESQLYRTVNPQRKCLLTSSQGSCKKVGAFPPEFRKKKKKHKKFGSPYRTTNFKSDFATACPKPPPYFKAKPRNSRSRCRDSEDRKTPWVLSKRCSKLRCFELNLSPERLFRARGSPSDNRSARGYFHTSVPERRHRMSVHEGLSTHTDLRRISNQTHISWSRSISESVINFTTQSETPPRKLPSQCSSSSPSIYGNSSTSTGERIIKLKSNNGEELFCLQKRYQKSVGNLLFCVRYAYYSFGVYLAIRNH